MKLLLLGFVTALLVTSCSMKERDRLTVPKAPVSGNVSGAMGKGSVYAVLYRLLPTRPEPLAHQLLGDDRRFYFNAPLGQELGIASFEDLNRNRRQDVGEPAGFMRLPKLTQSSVKATTRRTVHLRKRSKPVRHPITVPIYQTSLAKVPAQARPAPSSKQQVRRSVKPAAAPVVAKKSAPAKRRFFQPRQPQSRKPVAAAAATTAAKATPKPRVQSAPTPQSKPPVAKSTSKQVAPRPGLGDVVNLSHSRFSNRTAALGFDRPNRFVSEQGFGLYFLSRYRKDRIPVVCIHSSGGCAQDWRGLLPRLDTSRYQALVYHYPTGMPFDRAADSLQRMLVDLSARLRFRQVHVLGHGTGGLIGYRLAEWSARNPRSPRVGNLVTLATPWSGLPRTAGSVRRAHSSWDLRQGSSFMRELQRTPLPKGVRHHVIVANKNRVHVGSQLALGKRAATFTYNTDERAIMRSSAAARQVNRCLAAR